MALCCGVKGVTIEHDSLNYWFSHLTLTSEGNVMVSFLETPLAEDLPFGAQLIDYIKVQMVDMSGNLLWDNPVRVDTGDCLYYPDMYIVPFIAPDEEGGAYVCWFTSLYPPVPSSSIFVQRVKADGTLGFVDGPANVSVNEINEHWEPAICKLPGDPNFYVFWREFHYNAINLIDQIGVYGQKISPTGQRMWGEEAKAFVPLSTNWDDYWGMVARPGLENDMAVFYFRDFWEIQGQDTIHVDELFAMRINTDGDFVWEEEHILVSGYQSGKGYLDACAVVDNQWVAVWSDERASGEPYITGIYAQNIGLDGTLGPLSVPESSGSTKNEISLYPNPFHSVVTFEINHQNHGKATLSIFDAQGRLVTILVNETLPSGKQTVSWKPDSKSSGIYYYRFVSGDDINIGKLVRY